MTGRERVLTESVPERGPRRTVVFEPRNADGWDRISYEHRRGAWTGLEIGAESRVATGDEATPGARGRRRPGPDGHRFTLFQ